ncbi:MAG TPA: hypothetical protein VFN61_09185 [Acidimicrobiales bacterium]|nr:hypothetical protein [Acidimicrobiales bacterium]
MVSLRAARRYRWRLCGGRLTAGDGSLRFAPNALERKRGSSDWVCSAGDVAAIRSEGRIWLAVETPSGTERFRVFGAPGVAADLQDALSSRRTQGFTDRPLRGRAQWAPRVGGEEHPGAGHPGRCTKELT